MDFETASVLDIKVVGLDRYARHPSTKALMLGWAFDDDAPSLWVPAKGEPIPKELEKALLSDVRKIAWNAPFERAIFQFPLKTDIPLELWDDAMAWARHLSLPGKLDLAGPALGLGFASLKAGIGKALIKKFSVPYHKGGEETLFGISEPQFHDWEDSPREWAQFEEYCKQDVIAEREIFKVCAHIPLPEKEQRGWILDQHINERGIPVNRKFVENALKLSIRSRDELMQKLITLTGLKNPNSRDQFLSWAQGHGYPYQSLGKNLRAAAMAQDSGIDKTLREALTVMQEAKKTSYTKFEKILQFLSDDDRLRHQFVFLGGARTGRWAGKDSQVQNQARPMKAVEKKYNRALEIIENCNYEAAVKEFPSITISENGNPVKIGCMGMAISCVRSSFQAPPGKKLVVCDLGSIENRVLGFLAKCDAILKVFREGRDAYLDFAGKFPGETYEKLIKIVDGVHKPKDEEAAAKRQVAKPAVLGAGYGLGPGVTRHCSICDKQMKPKDKHPSCHAAAKIVYKAEIKKDDYGNDILKGLMGYADNMGVKLTPEQAYLAWATFREAYPEVVKLWKDLENAAVSVLESGKPVSVGCLKFMKRTRTDGSVILRLELPSGRGLHYINARVEIEKSYRQSDGEEYEKKKLMYDGIGHGVGQIGKGQKWGPVYTYGGKITENGDQGFSRDILLEAMFLADEAGAEIVMHVHDEIVTLEDDDPFAFGLEDLKRCMETTPEWAPGLLLGAEGWEGKYYKK